MKRRVSVDFDGVLNDYQGYSSSLGEPRPFVKDFLKKLSEDYEVILFTCRDSNEVRQWLLAYDLSCYVEEVTRVKTPSIAYIDDRAIRFDGDYNKTLLELENFKPYWDKNSITSFVSVEDSFDIYVRYIQDELEEYPIKTVKELDEKIKTLTQLRNDNILKLFDEGKITFFDNAPCHNYDFDLEEED